jgi:hypothetical protein
VDPEASEQGPAAHQGREPETLIGQFILALALDDNAQLAALKEQLIRVGLSRANNAVIVAVAHGIVNMRWPDSYESDAVSEAVRLAVAMSPRSDTDDIEAVNLVVRLALGEQHESSISGRSMAAHRLFVVWAFVRQLALHRDAVAAVVCHAEQAVIGRGFSPTPAATET